MSISLRKRFVEVYAWSTFMYECEAWTINREMESVCLMGKVEIRRGKPRVMFLDSLAKAIGRGQHQWNY